MQIETIPDIEVIEHLDFDAELACEGENHMAGWWGCVPSQPAAFVLIKPCCSHRPLVCAGNVADLATDETVVCTACGALTRASEWGSEPIQRRS